MSTVSIKKELIDELSHLTKKEQKRLLTIAKSFTHAPQRGRSGRQLIKFAGRISTADLDLMEKAIEEGCEVIDTDGW